MHVHKKTCSPSIVTKEIIQCWSPTFDANHDDGLEELGKEADYAVCEYRLGSDASLAPLNDLSRVSRTLQGRSYKRP